MTAYTRTAFWGFVWVSAGAVVANVFGYLLRLLLARHLSVEEYGLIYSVTALFGLVSVFQHLGLGEAIAKRISGALARDEEKERRSILAWSALILYASTVAIGALALLLAPWIATHYMGLPGAANLIRIFAIGFALSPIGVLIPAAFQGMQRMRLLALYNALQSLILFAATLAFFSRSSGAQGAMYAYVAMYALQHLVFIPVVLRMFPSEGSLLADPKLPAALLAYGIPVMLTGVASTLLTFTDTFLLTLLSDLAQVGIYQAALPTAMALTFFSGVLVTVLLPLVSQLWGRGERELIGVAVGDLYKYSLIVMLPLAAAAMFYPELILNLLFGAAYLQGAPVLRVLAGTAVLLTLNAITMAALSGMGFPKDTTKAVTLGALLNVALCLALIPLYGGLGAAIAAFFGSLSIFALASVLLQRRIAVRVHVGALVRVVAAGALFCLALWLCRTLPLPTNQYAKIALALVAGGCAYLLALFALRAITVGELLLLKERILKGSRTKKSA